MKISRTVTELDLWHQTVVLMEECDAAAGITDPGTVSARAALDAAVAENRKPS